MCSLCLSTSSPRSLLLYSRDGNLLNCLTNQYSYLFHVHDNDDDLYDGNDLCDDDDDADEDHGADIADNPQLHP